MLVSLVIRTLNEARHLPALLESVSRQVTPGFTTEVVLVDSGSTDATLQVAAGFGARIVTIEKKDFTFGRSLNVGCEVAKGDILVFISGHCIPCFQSWLDELTAPIRSGVADYSYGRQIGNDTSKFSERQLFRKYFPETSKIPQDDFFVNNANSALSKSAWEQYRFDEILTGLEDMELGKRLISSGKKIAYCADAPVYHLHDETWRQVRRRYEREAVALQRIMPEIHISFGDFLRFLISSLLLDFGAALQERKLHRELKQIFMFRLMQLWGTYQGNRQHRIISNEMKYRYFYPK